jgi:hypothetical protein
VYTMGRCKPGLAVKAMDGWTSIYAAAPNIPAPVLRGIARFARAHVYNDAGDVLTGTRDLLAVHTTSGGRREFRLPAKAEVIHDLYENRTVARRASRFTVEMAPVSSALWYTGTERALAPLRASMKSLEGGFRR